MAVKNIISASFGNDSIAMIQWAHETGLKNVSCVYCNTGWAAPNWPARVNAGKELCVKYGFDFVELKSMGMEELVRIKKGFPGNALQFCTAWLKGMPFLEWLENNYPDDECVVLVGKRRAESEARKNTPEFIYNSEYHGDRTVWHPLYLHTDEQRNELVKRSGLPLLPYRSQECSPCVNANRQDFMLLSQQQIERVSELEVEVGKPMFRPKRFGAVGIYGVMVWAKHGRAAGGGGCLIH